MLKDSDQIKDLDIAALKDLAQKIRTELINTVTKTGGHLGPNLGVVELTIAIHKVFDSPNDKIVFDTGHQSYVHKLLTGRASEFSTIRQKDGLSGYPSRSESEHDIVENSHASTALSWIDGIADGLKLQGINNHVVGVIGDGALTGGMAWEAINNIAGKKDRPLVIIVNDNGRSYAPTIGGIANYLSTLRTTRNYEKVLSIGKKFLLRIPVIGNALFKAIHGLKRGIGDLFFPEGMFQDMGLKYIGPLDGHDLPILIHGLERAKQFGGPVIVHCITQKGRGFIHAENDLADHFHGISAINPETGLPLKISENTWTGAFADSIVSIGEANPKVVALTAAMLAPTGLTKFANRFPERVFDVGIAEQHAITSAAGMAFAGLHPVVALYATFLNRAFDQVLFDCALHKAGVTFVLDRSGITGDDGASHNGVWDMALMSIVPDIKVFAPRDKSTLLHALNAAINISDGPTVVRFPKGELPSELIPAKSENGIDYLVESKNANVIVVAIGPMANLAVKAVEDAGYKNVTVINTLQVLPVSSSLIDECKKVNAVLTIEDGLVNSGIGTQISQQLRDHNCFVPVINLGTPGEFLSHGSRAQIMNEIGLDINSIQSAIQKLLG